MLVFIYITVFINIVSFSIVFPLLPLYAKTYEASDLTIGMLAACSALAQLIFSPLWGGFSDRLGRKSIMIFGLLGIAASFIIFGMAGSIAVLFIARFLQGIFSGAAMPAARAYVADITRGKERVRAMGRVGASLSLGIILGPAIGGLLAGIDIVLPFFAGSCFAGRARLSFRCNNYRRSWLGNLAAVYHNAFI